MSNDRSVAIKGGFWTSVSTAVTLLATFGRVMILTRFLEKSDFGVVSIINMVIALCLTFTDLGFASVIMYKQRLTDREFSSLYWIQLLLFSGIYIILWILSPWVSSFYNEPLLATLIPIASLSVLFQAVGKLHDSVLQKQYRFKSLAFRNIISNLVSLVLAGWMAWKGYGIYSLIYSTLCQAVILNLWNFVSGYKIQRVIFAFDWNDTLPLMKIGAYQTGTRILDFFSGKLDVMIIGKLLGTEALGVYDLAKELVFKFVDFIRTVVAKVALPILSNNNSDDDSVKRKFLMITKTVALLCIPICITIAVFSKDVVHIVYGEKYLEMSPLVSIFSLVTIITSISCFFDMLGIAKGRTDLNFMNTVYRIIITTPIIFLCSHWSITAVALGQLVATVVMAIIFWNVVVRKTYPMSLRLYLSQFNRLLYVMCIIGAIVYIVMNYVDILQFVDNRIVHMCLYTILFGVMSISTARVFLLDDIHFLINLIKRKNKF